MRAITSLEHPRKAWAADTLAPAERRKVRDRCRLINVDHLMMIVDRLAFYFID
jgi:hypothetical protein